MVNKEQRPTLIIQAGLSFASAKFTFTFKFDPTTFSDDVFMITCHKVLDRQFDKYKHRRLLFSHHAYCILISDPFGDPTTLSSINRGFGHRLEYHYRTIKYGNS